jgi:hypothetical protein
MLEYIVLEAQVLILGARRTPIDQVDVESAADQVLDE